MENRSIVHLDDGTKVYDFIRDGKVFAKVHIRPNDISFLDRKKTANERIEQIGLQLEAANHAETDDQFNQMFGEAEKAVVDVLNWLFDTADMSEVFKENGPFALTPDGEAFCMRGVPSRHG